jgi:tetratricopeptide (TPR) repeat protein
MSAQQAQGQAAKWSRRVRIILFACALLGLVAAAIFWLLNIQPGVFSTLFGASGVIFTLIALYPIIVPAKTPDPVSPSPQVTVNTPVTVNNVVPPTSINIYNVLPSAQPAPQVQASPASPTMPALDSQSSPAGVSGSLYANPSSLRSLPLAAGAKHIQRREKNVKEIYAQLIEPDVSAVALCGIGGVGKSTLAALVFDYAGQERKAGRGPFAGEPALLRLNENTSFLELATNIYACADRPMPPDFAHLPPQAQAYALFNALNTPASVETPRLIVLDQFENLLDPQTGCALPASAGVGELLDALNSQPCASRVLLTSRHVPHGTLDHAPAALHIYRVSDLNEHEGIELLRALGVAGDEAMLREAAKRCNGHALSLTLLGTLTLLKENAVGLATLLQDPAYTRLWEGRIEEKLLEKIFSGLPAPSRGLLCAFSIYREAVPVEAALAVLTGSTKGQALVLLGSLLEQHLVQVQPASGHYQVHPIVAMYASHHFYVNETTGGASARQAAHGRAAQYYLQIADANNATAGRAKGIRDAEPLIEAVWQLCQEGEFQKAYELMQREGLFGKLKLGGANTALLELCQLLLSGNWKYTPQQKAFFASNIALTSDVLGRKQEALSYYEQALQAYREVEDRAEEGRVLNSVSRLYYDLGRGQEALQSMKQALRLNQEEGDRKAEGATLNNLGLLYDDSGYKEEALRYFEQALRISQEEGEREGEGMMLNNIGRVYHSLGKKQKALSYYEQALRISQDIGNRRGEGLALHNIGMLYSDWRHYNVALACILLAKQLYEQVQSPFDIEDEIQWIASLRKRIGEEQFAILLAQVEREGMEQVVERGLREMLNKDI